MTHSLRPTFWPTRREGYTKGIVLSLLCIIIACQAPDPAPLAAVPKEGVGTVSWAVIDTDGKLRGYNIHRTHKSASLTKAMLAVAHAQDYPRSDLPGRETMKSMITISDNAAADRVLSWTGTRGLERIAKQAGMRDFDHNGYWANADLSAYDQARFWYKLPSLIPPRHRRDVMGMFASVAPYQHWGQGRVASSRGWQVYQKSGWRPEGGVYRFNNAVRACRPRSGCWVSIYLSENMASAGQAHWIAQEWAQRMVPTCKKTYYWLDVSAPRLNISEICR
jgi:hypothetical protein